MPGLLIVSYDVLQVPGQVYAVNGPSMLTSMDDFLFNLIDKESMFEMKNIGHYAI